MKTESQLIEEAQAKVKMEQYEQQIKAGKGDVLQSQAFIKAFPQPADYTTNPISKCEYDNPGYLCAFDSNNNVRAFLPRTVCSPDGINYVKKDAGMWYKINTRWFVPLYIGLGGGLLFSLIWFFLDPTLGFWIFLIGSGIGIAIAYLFLLSYYWQGYKSFRTSPFKIRDEYECSKFENLRKYTDIAAKYNPPQAIAFSLDQKTNKVGSVATASRYDYFQVGSTNNNLASFQDANLLQPQSSYNIDYAKSGIGTVLKDLRLLMLQKGAEGIQVGVGQQPIIKASTIAEGQVLGKELPLGVRYLRMLESYKNPANNKLQEQIVQRTEQF